VTYPTVEHAYWTLSTDDDEARRRIIAAPRAYAAFRIGQGRRAGSGGPRVQLAVMLSLLRAKFAQHPDLADRLVATGTSRLVNGVAFTSFWGTQAQGRNWLGRLLEVVRSELAAPGFGAGP
jgi:predicted NAD-dependent protein-ADP-ribosyltransferase YbiA (DUF1768 family)